MRGNDVPQRARRDRSFKAPDQTEPVAQRVDNGDVAAASPGLIDPARITVLQRMVGNAAVVRLLRESGQLPTSDHDVAVQRSATDVIRSSGRPLESGTRAEMESRLGADLADVRVHDDAAAAASAAQLGARAYTSGSHVVIGEGGSDKHTLAHELTHVLQQREGSVAGTDNGSGLRVSDPGDRFERAAEANARRVMAAPIQRHDHSDSADRAGHATSPGQSGVPAQRATAMTQIQCLAAQISGLDGDGKVKELILGGRPDSPYTGTMGDHSTGYIVQQTAVERAVVGRTPAEAVAQIKDLYDSCRFLPGTGLVDGLPLKQKTALNGHKDRVRDLHAALITPGRVTAEATIPALQDLISAYLSYRELIPLTTINVKQISQGRAGKGHGEAGNNAIVSAYFDAHVKADAPASAEDVAAAKRAMADLLDPTGVTLIAVETEEAALAAAAPGLDPATTPAKRVELVVHQHIGSIEMAYPGLITALWGDDFAAPVTYLTGLIGPLVARESASAIALYLGKINQSDARLNLLRGGRRGFDGNLTGKDASDWDAELVHRNRFKQIVETLGGVVPGQPPSTPPDISGGRPIRDRSKKDGGVGGKRSRDDEEELPKKSLKSAKDKSAKAKKPAKDEVSDLLLVPEEEEDPNETGSLAVQVTMDGGRVKDLIVNGRPKPAFGTSMGAHTTSWLVHVEAVRNAVRGQGPRDALVRLAKLAAETGGTRGPLEGAGFEFSPLRAERLETTEKDLKKNLDKIGEVGPTAAVMLLQTCISSLLVYTESLPGATLNGVDTGGHGEGDARRNLLGYEDGSVKLSKTDVEYFVKKLLDTKAVTTEKQMAALWANHKRVIERAFPQAAKVVKW